jgi:hypothetical protein
MAYHCRGSFDSGKFDPAFSFEVWLCAAAELPFLENFRFLKSKIQQLARRTDIDAWIRALVFCRAGVSRVSRLGLAARKQPFCGLREAWNSYGKAAAV